MGTYPNDDFRKAIAKRFGNRFYLRAIIDPAGSAIEITGKNSIISVSTISQEVPLEIDRMQEVNFADMTIIFNDPSKYLLTTYGNPTGTNFIGRELALRLYIDGQAGYMTVFRGIIRQPFVFYKGQAELTVENIVAQYLYQELRIVATSVSPTYRAATNGSLEETIAWNTGSTGSLGTPTTYAGAQLGQWTIRFTDVINFLVTGPGCEEKPGSTAADFYDGTDATDSQICIPSGNWGGTPAEGDTVSFFVSANIGVDWYIREHNLALGMWELLVDYGGLSTDLIDYGGTGIDDYDYIRTNSFNLAYYVYDAAGCNPFMSFDQPISILEACQQFLQHVCGTLVQMLDGRIRIFTHFLFSEKIFRYAGHVIDVNANSLSEITNEIIAYYGWDYANQKYLYSYKYPVTDAANASFIKYGKKKTITIYLPGYYTQSAAYNIAFAIYDRRHDPLRLYNLNMALDNLHLEIGDTFNMEDNELARVLDDTSTATGLFIFAYSLNLLELNRINVQIMDTAL